MLLGDNLVDELRGCIAHSNNNHNHHNNNNNTNTNNSSSSNNSSGNGSLGGEGSLGGGGTSQGGAAGEPSMRRSYSNVALREDYLDDADGPGKSGRHRMMHDDRDIIYLGNLMTGWGCYLHMGENQVGTGWLMTVGTK